MSVMEDIEKARRRLGCTVAAVSKKAGIHPSTYIKGRDGGNSPTDDTIDSLVDALEAIEREQVSRAERLKQIGAPKRSAA